MVENSGTFTETCVIDKNGKPVPIKRENGTIYVRGSLDLNQCTNITQLPENLFVEGGLDINGCLGLTELPEGLRVMFGISADYCANLVRLPERLICSGYLYLSHCKSIETFPRTLNVGDDFIIDEGTEPLTLPDELYVGKNMVVSSKRLRKLPEVLVVGGDLNLTGCSVLTLPERLQHMANGKITLPNGKLLMKVNHEEKLPDEAPYQSVLDRSTAAVRRVLKGEKSNDR